jgi:hypothetical protein
MNSPCNLDDHDGGPAPRTLAPAWVSVPRRSVIAMWTWLIRPGAAEILAILAVILFEAVNRALAIGAMVIGHD